MPIFHSIRGRLIAGFTLLTLLTVTLLGILVLSLMQRYVAQQEIDYLEQNAIALARQSERYFAAPLPPPALASLARTASLLGNFQVRILDANEIPLIDSTAAPANGQMTWLVAAGREPFVAGEQESHDFTTEQEELDIFFIEADEMGILSGTVSLPRPPVAMLDHIQIGVDQSEQFHPSDRAMPRMLRIIRRQRGEWGPLLRFEAATDVSSVETYTGESIDGQRNRSQDIAEIIVTTTVTDRVATGTIDAVDTVQTIVAPHESLATPRNRSFYNVFQRLWPQPPRQQVTTPIVATEGVVGYVQLSSTPGIATEALVALRRLFVLAAAGVSVVAVGVGLVMSRGLTAPIQLLSEATDRMNKGDLSARAAVQSNDEIGQLAGAFNRMATALEQSFRDLAAERDALRNFVADASHELRTPITALRTFTDLLRDGGTDAPTQAEFLAESAAQVQRLERLTENLLNLSRFDGGLVEIHVGEIAAADLLDHVVTLMQPLAAEQSVTLTVAPPPTGLTIACDRQQMERALVNLVENAIKFTLAGGAIQIGAATQDGAVELWVSDTGIGIAATEQAEIFRRFYRGQNATNGGSGLGLAIVQSIMTAHGGTVRVESKVGEGSRFVLRFALK